MLAALFLWILPRTAPSFILLCVTRLLLGYCMGFCITNPLIADYIKNESRGKAVAFQTIGIFLGESFAMIVLIGGTINMELNKAYTLAASTLVFMAMLSYCLIREPVIKDRNTNKGEEEATGYCEERDDVEIEEDQI